MSPILNFKQLQYLSNVLHNSSLNIEIQLELAKPEHAEINNNDTLVSLFIASKEN